MSRALLVTPTRDKGGLLRASDSHAAGEESNSSALVLCTNACCLPWQAWPSRRDGAVLHSATKNGLPHSHSLHPLTHLGSQLTQSTTNTHPDHPPTHPPHRMHTTFYCIPPRRAFHTRCSSLSYTTSYLYSTVHGRTHDLLVISRGRRDWHDSSPRMRSSSRTGTNFFWQLGSARRKSLPTMSSHSTETIWVGILAASSASYAPILLGQVGSDKLDRAGDPGHQSGPRTLFLKTVVGQNAP